ncbi:MAG: hypothetical protein A2X77_01170 [Gammaproteobacteria bacterium GWE2_42_36]|nr:MAG: hypothetical protein A2X77_01170 [Gammaproteobacteria bacterium GWE2_42_36]HCU05299.1 hypothetical protein [Coxiellaceae bacterium]
MKKQTSFLITALFFVGLSAFSSALLAQTDSAPAALTATPSKVMGLLTGWRDKFFSGKPSISSAPSISVDENNILKNQTSAQITENNSPAPNPAAGMLQQLRFNYKVMLYNKAQLASLQDQVKDLQTQLKLLQPNSTYRLYWFTAGALTLFVGLLFGVIISRLFRSREKRLF